MYFVLLYLENLLHIVLNTVKNIVNFKKECKKQSLNRPVEALRVPRS